MSGRFLSIQVAGPIGRGAMHLRSKVEPPAGLWPGASWTLARPRPFWEGSEARCRRGWGGEPLAGVA